MNSVKQQVLDLMRSDSRRWWGALDLENALHSSAAARRLRELVEEDEKRVAQLPVERRKAMRDFEERKVDNYLRPGKHKEFRFKGRQLEQQLGLFSEQGKD